VRFDEFSSNDFENIRFWMAGDKDFLRSNFALGADFADLAEPRTSPDAAGNAVELTQYRRINLEGAYTYSPGRWAARLDGTYRNLDYENTQTLTGTIDNSDRDRKILDFGIRFGYEISELYGLFLEPRSTTVSYEQPVDRNGFERSSEGYEIRLGTSLAYSGVITGELFVGYLDREFDDIAFGNVRGPSFGGENDGENVTEYRLVAGDRVPVAVFGHKDVSGEFGINGANVLSMPLVPEIKAAGLPVNELEAATITRFFMTLLHNFRRTFEAVFLSSIVLWFFCRYDSGVE
jgi:hypothetical protein